MFLLHSFWERKIENWNKINEIKLKILNKMLNNKLTYIFIYLFIIFSQKLEMNVIFENETLKLIH